MPVEEHFGTVDWMLMSEVAADRWRWSADSYEHAAATGVFGDEPRVELVDGEVFRMAPMLPGHALVLGQIQDRLTERIDRARWIVRAQLPVRLDDDSEPEPDVWVAEGPPARYRLRHPAGRHLALLVEVADTSLAFDRQVKIPRYAMAGVGEVWLVSLPERVVYSFAEPDPAAGEYRRMQRAASGALVAAERLGIELAVDDLLVPDAGDR